MTAAIRIATSEDIEALRADLAALRAELRGARIIPAPEWITVEEYMRRENVSRSTVLRREQRGEIETNGLTHGAKRIRRA